MFNYNTRFSSIEGQVLSIVSSLYLRTFVVKDQSTRAKIQGFYANRRAYQYGTNCGLLKNVSLQPEIMFN